MTPAYCRAGVLLPDIRNTSGLVKRICFEVRRQPIGARTITISRNRISSVGYVFECRVRLFSMRFSGINVFKPLVQLFDFSGELVEFVHREGRRRLGERLSRGDPAE